MNFPYFPYTGEDVAEMLGKCSMKSLDDLYSDVPSDFIYRGRFDLPDSMSEIEIRSWMEKLGAMNSRLKVFAGQGAYDHYSPSVIPALLSRGEFLTAYTPYQAEVSQGTLRYIFEYQSMICELTGMDVCNASMYDGATAAAEAAMMCVACTKKKSRVLVSSTLLDNVMEVISTYTKFHGIPVTVINDEDGQTSYAGLAKELEAGDVAGVIVPSVNRFGIIEDPASIAESIHAAGALMVMYCDPSALAVLKTPAEWGADIVCGDCQSLGIPLCFGGPYIGYLACREAYQRKLPGRIVGQTTDVDGKRAFVLTLQAREQHIRREKATSNICSNQSLMALYVTIYLSLMGPEGMKEVNELSFSGAHYLHDRLLATGLFKPVYNRPFLKEFVLSTGLDSEKLCSGLMTAGYLAALPTREGYVSFCVTENRNREEADALVDEIIRLSEQL